MVPVRWKWYVPLVVGRFTARASPEPPMHMRQGLCEKHDGTTNEATATDVSLRMDGQGGDCRLGELTEILRFQELRDICCNDGRQHAKYGPEAILSKRLLGNWTYGDVIPWCEASLSKYLIIGELSLFTNRASSKHQHCRREHEHYFST